MTIDVPRIVLAAISLAVLAAQMWAWNRIRPTGFRRSLWIGFAVLVFGNGYGVIEFMLNPTSQIRLLFVFAGLTWIGWGFILEGKSHSPPPRHDRGRRT